MHDVNRSKIHVESVKRNASLSRNACADESSQRCPSKNTRRISLLNHFLLTSRSKPMTSHAFASDN